MFEDRYPAQVFWSDEDEGYIAIAPDLPGCSAFGESEGEALSELKHAISAWKDAAVAAGNPIPAASNFADQSFSGKVALRMPRTLHRDLVNAARAQGTSLNQYMVYLLSKNAHADVIVSSYNRVSQVSPWSIQRVTAVCHQGSPVTAFGEVHMIDAGTAMAATALLSYGRREISHG